MEDMGEDSYALGVKTTRERAARTLTISQGAYLLDSTCRTLALSPLPWTQSVSSTQRPPPHAVAKTRYQSAVGALLHAVRAIRSDITFAVIALSQFCKALTESTGRPSSASFATYAALSSTASPTKGQARIVRRRISRAV